MRLDDAPAELTDEQVALVNDNLGLVGEIAKESKDRRLDFDDRFQVGVLGLIRAVQLFDPSKGFTLATYADAWIKSAIQRASRKASPMIGLDDLDGLEPLAREDAHGLLDSEEAARLRAVVLSMPEEARRPILDRYWHGKKPRGESAKDFECQVVHALRKATRNGRNIPSAPPEWIDVATGKPYLISRPGEDDRRAMKAMERLQLEPRFPVLPFTPGSKCAHKGPTPPKGSKDYCPVCDRSGMDGLVVPLNVAPLPIDKPKPPPTTKPKENRRERRKRARAVALSA